MVLAFVLALMVVLSALAFFWLLSVLSGASQRRSNWLGGVFVFVVLFGAVATIELWADCYHPREVTGLVKSRYIKNFGDGNNRRDRFMVEIDTDNGIEVIQCRDSSWALDWHSSDTYAILAEGQRVRITIAGPRVPFLSMFPRLVRVN
jgi:uncharacterized protein (DUF58 family)